MKKCGVYLLVNAISNKNYVGSSTRLSQRISEHLSLLKKGKHYNFLIYIKNLCYPLLSKIFTNIII